MNDYLQKMKESGKYDHYAWPGGYNVLYLTEDGGTLCADCANENADLCRGGPDENDKQWNIVAYFIHWEGPATYCDNCNKVLESEYGDPDVENPEEVKA